MQRDSERIITHNSEAGMRTNFGSIPVDRGLNYFLN